MLILVICRPAEAADQAEFRRLVLAETAALRDLKGSGVLTGAGARGVPAPCSCSTSLTRPRPRG